MKTTTVRADTVTTRHVVVERVDGRRARRPVCSVREISGEVTIEVYRCSTVATLGPYQPHDMIEVIW